jgi:pseudaminic acid cytidylyltransferase
MKRLAIIPARGGSKRIPGKNIRNFCGSPIISYTLNTALKSELFDTIHVSTDCDAVVDIVKKLGFSIDFLRPAALADDYTPLLPVLQHVVDRYAEMGLTFDQIWCLLPCAPLLEEYHLRGAEAVFENSSKQSPLIPVLPFPAPVEWASTYQVGGRLKFDHPESLMMRSQDLETRYYDAGVFSIYTPKILASRRIADKVDFIGYILSKNSVVDIDDEDDWRLAEALYLHFKLIK